MCLCPRYITPILLVAGCFFSKETCMREAANLIVPDRPFGCICISSPHRSSRLTDPFKLVTFSLNQIINHFIKQSRSLVPVRRAEHDTHSFRAQTHLVVIEKLISESVRWSACKLDTLLWHLQNRFSICKSRRNRKLRCGSCSSQRDVSDVLFNLSNGHLVEELW